MSERATRKATGLRFSIGLGMLLALGATVPVAAGSIFMKNGYIIHGPVVDRTNDAIVLGWENGKLTLHSRFIETISFDPGEEEQLAELAALRLQEQRVAEEMVLQASTPEEFADDLPPSIDVFIELHAKGLADMLPGAEYTTGDGSDEPDLTGGGDTEEPGSDQETGVDVMTPFDNLVAEPVFDAERRFSLRPPKGWDVTESEAPFQAVGPPAADGFRPSLNVFSVPRGEISWAECVEVLKAEQQRTLEDFEVIAEGSRELANGEEVFEVIGRGSLEGKTLVVRQLLQARDEELWLFSGFSRAADGDVDFSVIEASLMSFTATDDFDR